MAYVPPSVARRRKEAAEKGQTDLSQEESDQQPQQQPSMQQQNVEQQGLSGGGGGSYVPPSMRGGGDRREGSYQPPARREMEENPSYGGGGGGGGGGGAYRPPGVRGEGENSGGSYVPPGMRNSAEQEVEPQQEPSRETYSQPSGNREGVYMPPGNRGEGGNMGDESHMPTGTRNETSNTAYVPPGQRVQETPKVMSDTMQQPEHHSQRPAEMMQPPKSRWGGGRPSILHERPQVNVVEIDGLVALKIMKHCHELLPQVVIGQLLGLDNSNVLEVTNCFPFPTNEDGSENSDQAALTAYQRQMMVQLREVNVDSNTVGWYQSNYLGSFLSESMIRNQFAYQNQIKNCVCIVYDPLRTTASILSLKAYRLTDTFMKMYKAGTYTKGNDRISPDVFEEVPIKIRNSHLAATALLDFGVKRQDRYEEQGRFDALDAGNSFLEKSIELLIDSVEDLDMEQARYAQYRRALQRQQAAQQAFIQKRRQENEGRRKNGEETLPLQDPNLPIFKPIDEPSLLDSILIRNQINNYCRQINQYSANNITKLHGIKGLLQQP